MTSPNTPRNFTIVRWCELVIRSFRANNCLLRAAALSYTTILSLVPLFALAFALLKGLGVPNKLAPLLLEQVAAGSQELVTRILTYINNTNLKSLGAIGLATLMVTVISLLGEIEDAFNAIWGVKETRPWARKFSDYLSVVLTGPLLLFAAISITTSLQSQTLVKKLAGLSYIGPAILNLFQFIPYVSIWLALVFLYIFIPNTRVRFSSAMLGGILAGTLWQAAQWVYLHLQLSASSYNAIYGTLAILPAFMVWIYASWVIVLLGVEVVYAHQHHSLLKGGPPLALNQRERTALCLALVCAVVRAFSGSTPHNDESLAEAVGVTPLQARELLNTLVEIGILARTADSSPTYLPAHDPAQMPVSKILQTIATAGGSSEPTLPEQVAHLLATIDQATTEHLNGLTLAELAKGGHLPISR